MCSTLGHRCASTSRQQRGGGYGHGDRHGTGTPGTPDGGRDHALTVETSSTSASPAPDHLPLRPSAGRSPKQVFLDGKPEGLNRRSCAPHLARRGVGYHPCPAGVTPAPTSNTREPMPSRPDPKETEAVLMGGEARYTVMVVRLGTRLSSRHRIWRLGFAAREDDVLAHRQRCRGAMRVTARLIRDFNLTEEASIRLARAMGQTDDPPRRMADQHPHHPVVQTGGRHRRASGTAGGAQKLLPDMETLLLHVWRRQLVAAVSRKPGSPRTAERGRFPHYFPLIVGVSRTWSPSPRSTGTGRGRPRRRGGGGSKRHSADIVASCGGRIVKPWGTRSSTSPTTRQLGRGHRLQLAAGSKPTSSAGRAGRSGLRSGAGLLGDVFGTTVNRASRLTSFARPARSSSTGPRRPAQKTRRGLPGRSGARPPRARPGAAPALRAAAQFRVGSGRTRVTPPRYSPTAAGKALNEEVARAVP